jgi:hypothetical protein
LAATGDIDCWVLSNGGAGMLNQCIGLAEALDVAWTDKRVAIRQPWLSLPPGLWLRPFAALGPGSSDLRPPWPDLLIASGRQTVAIAAAIRRASAGRTFTVQIQKPGIPPRHFDLVVTPQHDRLAGANVVATMGGLNRITPARLETEAVRFADSVAHLPRPLIAVLVGGSSKAYRMTDASCRDLAAKLRALAEREEAGLLVTASRRTGEANAAVLREALDGVPHLWWDGSGENPFLGWLGLADGFVVTADSVNMISEACATGKPVMVHDLPGGTAKFDRFHRLFREAGLVRPFDGRLERYSYQPLNETAEVARIVRERMAGR